MLKDQWVKIFNKPAKNLKQMFILSAKNQIFQFTNKRQLKLLKKKLSNQYL